MTPTATLGPSTSAAAANPATNSTRVSPDVEVPESFAVCPTTMIRATPVR